MSSPEQAAHGDGTRAAPSVTDGPGIGAVTVVVPAYNGGDELLACLKSVAASTYHPVRVVVVDNASIDGSVDDVARLLDAVELIRNATNLGFAAACNRGIQLAMDRDDAYVLLLNQDARVEPDAIAQLVDLARRLPRAAVIGAKTLSARQSTDGTHALLYNGAWRRGLPLWQKIPGIGRPDRGGEADPREVDYVWGHGMLLRTAALREVGLFDEEFFMYHEDLDLCMRIQQAGWQAWCEPRSIIWHAVDDGPRAKHSQPWRWQMKVESARHFHRKRYRPVRAECLWCATLLREAATLACEGHLQAFGHLLRAWGRSLSGGAANRDPRRD